jgi:hypothetical protein
VARWSGRAGLPTKRLLGWIGLGTSKFYQWWDRYGQVNEHNGKIPRDWWLEDWENRAILDYFDCHPLEGYRRLTFMMLDDNVVAVSPTSVYRVLKAAGRLDRHHWAPSKKGTGFEQPDGRTLLVAARIAPQNEFFGQPPDLRCLKITAINLALPWPARIRDLGQLPDL